MIKCLYLIYLLTSQSKAVINPSFPSNVSIVASPGGEPLGVSSNPLTVTFGTGSVNVLLSTFSASNPGFVVFPTSQPVFGTFNQGIYTITIGTGTLPVIIVSTFSAGNPGFIQTLSSQPVTGNFNTGIYTVTPSTGLYLVSIISTFSSTSPGFIQFATSAPVTGVFNNGTYTVTPGTGNFSMNIVSTFSASNPGFVQTTSSLPVTGTFNLSATTVTTSNIFATRSDTYTGSANGTTVNMTNNPFKYFSIQVKGTSAAAASWDVFLEGSLNGTQFSNVLEHLTGTGDGETLYATSPFASLYFRSRCASVTLGSATNIVVTILGVQ